MVAESAYVRTEGLTSEIHLLGTPEPGVPAQPRLSWVSGPQHLGLMPDAPGSRYRAKLPPTARGPGAGGENTGV